MEKMIDIVKKYKHLTACTLFATTSLILHLVLLIDNGWFKDSQTDARVGLHSFCVGEYCGGLTHTAGIYVAKCFLITGLTCALVSFLALTVYLYKLIRHGDGNIVFLGFMILFYFFGVIAEFVGACIYSAIGATDAARSIKLWDRLVVNLSVSYCVGLAFIAVLLSGLAMGFTISHLLKEVESKKAATSPEAPADGPNAEPNAEPNTEPKAEPKVEPKVEPKDESKEEPKEVTVAVFS